MDLLKNGKGKHVRIKSINFTQKSFGLTPSMERMKGRIYRIDRLRCTAGKKGVVIQNYIWDVNDLEIAFTKKKQQLFHFDENLLGDI